MKQKRTSAILTLILAHFILAFFAFTHVVASLLVLPGPNSTNLTLVEFSLWRIQETFVPNFGILDETIGFVLGVGALAIAFVLALVWAIRLLVHRRKASNLFSPLLFLFGVIISFLLVIISPAVETAFENAGTRIAAAYWFVIGVVIIVLSLHLLVVGLKSSGTVKEVSLLSEEFEDDFEVIEEQVISPAVEEEKEEDVDEVEEVTEEIVQAEQVTVIREEVSEDLIRKIANEEIDKRLANEKVVVQPEPVKEEPKAVVKPTPAPTVEPKKVTPPPTPAPAVVKEKVERIPFGARMQIVEDQVKVDYNEIKSYLLSFGLNSRVSNVADSFRQGRQLFAKVTNSGNSGLKLYLPLDLADYKESKIPLKSAEGTKQYEEVPIFIYIRSELSMKRAKQLIDDVMLKSGITRKFDAEDVDHVKELA